MIKKHRKSCKDSASLLYSISPLFAVITFLRSPANLENPQIIDAVLKRLCMILYTLKYASQIHSKDSLTHQCSNNVVRVNVSVFLLKNGQRNSRNC